MFACAFQENHLTEQVVGFRRKYLENDHPPLVQEADVLVVEKRDRLPIQENGCVRIQKKNMQLAPDKVSHMYPLPVTTLQML